LKSESIFDFTAASYLFICFLHETGGGFLHLHLLKRCVQNANLLTERTSK